MLDNFLLCAGERYAEIERILRERVEKARRVYDQGRSVAASADLYTRALTDFTDFVVKRQIPTDLQVQRSVGAAA
jgi:uncharacterized protein YheU (UPF0270 family)